jgi:hypothetical protein
LLAGMSRLSYKLAKALNGGRAARPLTRERILANLLRKRAAAHAAGLAEQEARLREQIRWALPIRDGEDGGEDDPPAA